MPHGAKIKVDEGVLVKRPIRLHMTRAEADRLANILVETDSETGFDIDSVGFYSDLLEAIDTTAK